MPEWNFIDGIKRTQILDVNQKWISALNAAFNSKATCFQSNYPVNAGAATSSGKTVYGSNHEMSITDTVTHGEEAVIASALEKYGKNDKIEVIAFLGLDGIYLDIPKPCGNCRDAIKQYTDLEKLILINAPKLGGNAIVVPGKSYFFENYENVSGAEKQLILDSAALQESLNAEKMAYDIYSSIFSPKIYGAAILCENNLVFRGSFRGNVSYHPELPISSVISNFRDGSNDPNRKKVKAIIVSSTCNLPNVMYKDRQDALEFAEAIQSLNNNSGIPLPVYLINADTKIQNSKIYKTDTYQWLPYSFSPKNLGMEKKIVEGYRKLFL